MGLMSLSDLHGRPLRNLRVSVTDRCNLRCSYCMPEEEYTWLPRPALLTFEELTRLARVFVSLGVRKLRLTGGEPLLRRDLHRLVGMLAPLDGLEDLAMTTNAVLLADQARPLRQAGLGRLTVSLDTLRPERFLASTRRDELERVLAGLQAARAAGFAPVKLNCVVQRGFNDDELVELVDFARGHGAQMRFIEYMDVGGATRWASGTVVSRAEILGVLEQRFGGLVPLYEDPSAPAELFELRDGTRVGVIASTTAPFCGTCDRARLTADGHLFLCLYGRLGLDLGRKKPETRSVTSTRGRSSRLCGRISMPVTRCEGPSQSGRAPSNARAWARSSPPVRMFAVPQAESATARGQSPCSWR
jgi:cyclic pyranopterin phosphate synthase